MSFIYWNSTRKHSPDPRPLLLGPRQRSYDLKSYFNPYSKRENIYLKEKYDPNEGKIYSLPGTSEKKHQFPIKINENLK